MLASTKYSRWQNVGVNKILASTKCCRWQNTRVNKILTSTKFLHRQNTRVDKMLAHARKHLLNVWPGRVHSSWLLPDLANVLLRLPKGVDPSTCSRQVCHCHWPPCFYGQTLSCTVPARHAKYWRPPRFHWFSPNYSSQYLSSQASYKKLVKTKSNHHHCPISVYILITSNRGCHRDQTLRSLTAEKGCG